nr:hypothetical protein [Actinomadura madurae]
MTISRPPTVTGGIPVRPFGPPVTSRFTTVIRMISPKPSVTIAR